MGSTFSFDIPVEIVPRLKCAAPTRLAQQVIGLAPDQPAYRILVVDDSPDNLALLQQMLAGVGFEVQTAEGGQAALAVLNGWLPHLILMDIRMPGVDGYQAARQIKAGDGDRYQRSLPLLPELLRMDGAG